MNTITILKGVLRLTFALVISWGARAGEPPNVSVGELALLPEFCSDRVWAGRPAPSIARRQFWEAKLGKSWEGLHHYCWALVNVRRAALPQAAQHKRYLLDEAVADYQYAIDNSTSDFVLRPEMLVRLGEALAMRGQPIAAIDAFKAASESRADYWPAYQRMARVYVDVGLLDRAQAALEAGLRAVPGQFELRKDLDALLGKGREAGKPGTRPSEN